MDEKNIWFEHTFGQTSWFYTGGLHKQIVFIFQYPITSYKMSGSELIALPDKD